MNITNEMKQAAYTQDAGFRNNNTHFENKIMNIPFLSVGAKGWQLATEAFAADTKSYRRKQEWKSLFATVTNPRFAAKWFEILKSSDFIFITSLRKRLYLKPFRVYMSTKWNKKQRVKVISDTYRFITRKGAAFSQVINPANNLEIARISLNDTIEGTLNLGYDERYRKEGELVLSFESDQLGGKIVAAAFSFEETTPGNFVCRIGCVQGHGIDIQNTSKIVQKLLNGLRPKALIVNAVQELARELGCTAVYGSGDAIQAYRQRHFIHLPWHHTIEFNYDDIWSESGGKPGIDGWFELPLTPARKTQEELKSHKRALYRRRYAQLDHLSQGIADTLKSVIK